MSCAWGSTYYLNNGFTKTGHYFYGWGFNQASTRNYTNGQAVSNLNSSGGVLSMYALWKPNTYTIKYNGNGETSGTTSSSSHTYNISKNLTANGFLKKGYKFLGWSTSAAAITPTYTNKQSINLLTSNGATINLYAVWELDTFSLTLDGSDATNEYTTSVIATYNEPMPTIAKLPIRQQVITFDANEGLCDTTSLRITHEFDGYYTEKNGMGIKYYDKDGNSLSNWDIQSEITLYANWILTSTELFITIFYYLTFLFSFFIFFN